MSAKSTKKLTLDIFKERMNIVNKNILISGEYANNSTKMKCECLLDGNIWMARPNTLLTGSGCPKCKGRDASERSRLSQEEFESRVLEKNKNIEILGKYKKNTFKVKCFCTIHNIYFEKSASLLMSGVGCRECCSKNYSLAQTFSYDKFFALF